MKNNNRRCSGCVDGKCSLRDDAKKDSAIRCGRDGSCNGNEESHTCWFSFED